MAAAIGDGVILAGEEALGLAGEEGGAVSEAMGTAKEASIYQKINSGLSSGFGKVMRVGEKVAKTADTAFKVAGAADFAYKLSEAVYHDIHHSSSMPSTPTDVSQPPSIPGLEDGQVNLNIYAGPGSGVPRYPHQPVSHPKRPRRRKTHPTSRSR